MAKRYELTADDLMKVSDGIRARSKLLGGGAMGQADAEALGAIAALERKAGRPLTRNAYAMADAAGVREADGGPMGPAAARTAVERGAGTMAARELAGTGGDGTRAGSRMAPAIGKKWVNPLLAGQGGVYSGPIEEDTTPTIWPAITRGLTNPRDRPSVVNPMADAAGVREADGGPMGTEAARTAVERGAGVMAARELAGTGEGGPRAALEPGGVMGPEVMGPPAPTQYDKPEMTGPRVPIARIGGGRVIADGSGEVRQGAMMERVRFDPMTREQGIEAGIVARPEGRDTRPVMLESPGELRAVRSLRAGRDESQAMRSEAAGVMGERWRARQGARDAGEEMRAAGGNGRASDAARGELAKSGDLAREGARGEMRVREAGRTPQAVMGNGVGATYDPATGEWTGVAAERGAGVSAPAAMGTLDDADLLAGLTKYGEPKPMTPKDLDPVSYAKYMGAKSDGDRRAILTPPWTEDAKAAYGQYRMEAERRGLLPGRGGGRKAGGEGAGAGVKRGPEWDRWYGERSEK